MNKKTTILVAEPWDFNSPDGKNRIIGKIISIVNDKCIIFKANYSLKFNKKSGCILILTPRLKDGCFDNINNENVTVNGGLLSIEYKDEISSEVLMNNSTFVLIGTLINV